jgi:broad specificity phosphatase PhoE
MRRIGGLLMATGLTQASSLSFSTKVIHFVRHGQAMHNVNAERIKAEGCTHDEFIAAMLADDEFDAALTDIGRAQAEAAGNTEIFQSARLSTELVVGSPLSRALDTADITFPDDSLPLAKGNRISLESIREINGMMLNGKRRSVSELSKLYPMWDFSIVPSDEDEAWSVDLETNEAARERAYQSLCWMWERPESTIALFAHGGIYMLLMDGSHEAVEVKGDGVSTRFHNCELRTIEVTRVDGDDFSDDCGSTDSRPRFQLKMRG